MNGTKVIVTPGMIELGKVEKEKNYELGKKIIAFQISVDNRILITPDHYSSRTNYWIISKEDKNITTFGFVKNALFDDMKIKRPNLFSGVSKPKQNYEIVNNLIQEINSFGL